MDAAPVLALANCFVMLDALTPPYAIKNGGFFTLPVGRNQKCDGLADDFFGRIAKDALRTIVPTGDDAIQVLRDDCVITGLDDCREPLCHLRAAPAFGDVPREAAGVSERVAVAKHAGIDEHMPD